MNTISENEVLTSNEVLKLSAFLYLSEALVAQEYESCAALIASAKEFGAEPGEVSAVIAAFLKGERQGKPNEAKQGKNRLRSLLKE